MILTDIGSIPAHVHGRRFEMMVFGKTIPLSRAEAGQIPQFSFDDSLVYAEEEAEKNINSWNPASPPTMTAFGLLQAVQSALCITPPCKVEFVRTLGTPLDIHWGIDGYFRLAGTRIIVTVDLTTNWEKVRSGQKNADLFLTPADFGSELSLNLFACKVTNLFRKRFKEFQHSEK